MIQSEHYSETESALCRDPVIIEMAREMQQEANSFTLIPFPIDRPSFEGIMLGALREYKHRGGTITTHIGGPWAAIQILVGLQKGFTYRDFHITYRPPDWDWCIIDGYDGPGDTRYGNTFSLLEALDMIDEWYEENPKEESE